MINWSLWSTQQTPLLNKTLMWDYYVILNIHLINFFHEKILTIWWHKGTRYPQTCAWYRLSSSIAISFEFVLLWLKNNGGYVIDWLISQIHKFQNTPVSHPTRHHFGTFLFKSGCDIWDRRIVGFVWGWSIPTYICIRLNGDAAIHIINL